MLTLGQNAADRPKLARWIGLGPEPTSMPASYGGNNASENLALRRVEARSVGGSSRDRDDIFRTLSTSESLKGTRTAPVRTVRTVTTRRHHAVDFTRIKSSTFMYMRKLAG